MRIVWLERGPLSANGNRLAVGAGHVCLFDWNGSE